MEHLDQAAIEDWALFRMQWHTLKSPDEETHLQECKECVKAVEEAQARFAQEETQGHPPCAALERYAILVIEIADPSISNPRVMPRLIEIAQHVGECEQCKTIFDHCRLLITLAERVLRETSE